MKRSVILFSVLISLCFVSNAQVDTVRKFSDSTTIKASFSIQTDSTTVKIKGDTIKYALLYVFRPRNFVGSVISYNLKISNVLLKEQIIGRVKNNSKFEVRLYQEGKTEIFAQTESKKSVNIDVKYGKKYYLKCGITMGIVAGRPDLNLITTEQGELDYQSIEDK